MTRGHVGGVGELPTVPEPVLEQPCRLEGAAGSHRLPPRRLRDPVGKVLGEHGEALQVGGLGHVTGWGAGLDLRGPGLGGIGEQRAQCPVGSGCQGPQVLLGQGEDRLDLVLVPLVQLGLVHHRAVRDDLKAVHVHRVRPEELADADRGQHL